MSRDASVTLDWAGDTRVFRLPWGQLIMLQEACDAGPLEILRRLQNGTWRVQEISHVIRLSLIGGGMTPDAAHKLVKLYVEERPPFENLIFAQGLLAIGVQGAPDEKPGKDDAAATSRETE